jgi:UDP-3-O-acyl-N-acetylglucosamine deacetylase
MRGFALHSGKPASVTIERIDGPTTLGCGEDRASIGDLRVEGRERCSVAVLPSGRELAVVEHLLSAILGRGAFFGARIDVEGDELPLLDGCAAQYFDALAEAPSAPLRVLRTGAVEAHGTTIEVAPHDGVEVEVVVDFPAERFGQALRGSARWTGDPDDYRARIATARTFGGVRELEALRARGLAAHIPEGSVVALDDPRFGPSDPEEPIRHKLLDALGDLAALGAPLHGRVLITKPSHRGTRGALSRLTQLGDLLGR